MTLLLLAFMGLPTPAPDATEIRVVFFGQTGGVSEHAGRNRAHALLGDRFSVVDVSPRVYANEGRLALGVRTDAFHAFLAAGPIRREVRLERLPVLVGPFEVLFEAPGDPPRPETPALDLLEPALAGLERVEARMVDFVNAGGARQQVLELPGVAAESPLETDPYAWEMRFATRGDVRADDGSTVRLVNVGRPLGDGARRIELVRRLRAEKPDTIVLAAGGDMEQFSFVKAGEPDRQRPHTWTSFRELGVSALAPAAAEVAFGVDRLAREAQEHGVEVLAVNVADAPFARSRLVEANGTSVLLVGLVDPRMDAISRRRGFADRALAEPGPAVCEAVEAARTRLGKRPDVVVAFGLLSGADRAALVASCREVDVLLTDFSDHGFTPETLDAQITGRALRARERHPVSVVAAGRLRVGVVDLRVEDGQIVSARSRAVPVLATHPADPTLAYRVQKTRQDAYAVAQDVLLPDPGRLDADRWQQLAANLLRERFSAELAVIPRPPFPWPPTGPLTRLQAVADLNVPDLVEVVFLTAAQVEALARSPALGDVATSGLEPTGPLVLGRPIDARERYRVVTTDTLRQTPTFATILAGTADATGEGLRDAVIAELEARRTLPRTEIEALTEPQGAVKETRWVLDLQGLQVGVGRYSNFGETSASYRETRAISPDSESLAWSGGLVLRRDSRSVDWVNTARVDFAELDVAGDPPLETADRARASSELQVHALGFAAGVPYVNGAYDTEFTPTEGNRRKKQAEGALGLLWTSQLVTEVRLAAVVGHDFAAETNEPDVGALGALTLRAPLGPLVWWLESEGRYYLPELGEEDAGALGVLLKGRTGLDVPIVGGLSLSLHADVFAFRGRNPALRRFGSSVVNGVSLKFDQVFKGGFD